MQETPPPRRRRPPPRDDGPSLPFIPIVLGVIVLGFVIGAGLSVAGRHAQQSDVPVASAAPTFAATVAPATLAPVASPAPRASSKATARPSPFPSPSPSRSPSPSPSETPAASPSVPAASLASAAPVASSAPAATPAPQAGTSTPHAPAAPRKIAPAASATPLATAPPPVATATPAPLPAPTKAPAAPVAAATDDTTSEFGKLAAGVVRSYLAAIARGDLDGAYAQLGSSPGVASGSLPEVGIVTRSTRIVHVEARGGENSVTVNVDMQTANGAYFGQFTVHRSAGGAAIIVQHSIFKS